MTTTHHTHGPWTIEWDHQSNTPEFIRAFVDDEMEDVAIITPDTPVANAHLISAAPDMFQALQAIVDAFGDQNSLLVEQCKAALAKAKGEA